MRVFVYFIQGLDGRLSGWYQLARTRYVGLHQGFFLFKLGVVADTGNRISTFVTYYQCYLNLALLCNVIKPLSQTGGD
jgi:hypothetical protein